MKVCAKHGRTACYTTKEGYKRCKKCNNEKVMRRHQKVKRLLVESAGGKCIRCGYDKEVSALQFHHRDPKTKSFGIAQKMYSTKIALLKKELEKCDLICANCHFEIHAGQNRNSVA